MQIKSLTIALLMGGASVLAGCTEAHMRMPNAPVEAMETALLTGVGGKQSGGFDLGDARGNFVRSGGAYRERDYPGDRDPVLHQDGEAEFTVWGDAVEGRLSASCGSHATEIDTGSFAESGDPVSYSCRFARGGTPIDARLELGEPQSAKLLAPRTGFIFFRGRRMEIRSVHDFDNPGVARSGTAVGYTFLADGQEIGGVDLANAPYRVHLPRDPAYREAAIAATLAMAMFYDPEAMVGEEQWGPTH